jgi:hypothetical protein
MVLGLSRSFGQNGKARQLECRRALVFLDLLRPFTSGRSSPPAWDAHDGGDGRDGDGTASALTLSGDIGQCQQLIADRQ